MRYTGVHTDSATSQNFDLALKRVALSGTAFDPKLTWFLQTESSTLGNSNGVHLLDAWLGYSFAPSIGISMGRILVPYSRQFYTHPGELLFADLSAADYAFNLPRSMGATAGGRYRRLAYRFGALNSIRAGWRRRA